MKHGEVSNYDESNKFFKRAGKSKEEPKAAVLPDSPTLPDSLPQPTKTPSSLHKALLEDQQFKFLPNSSKEAEAQDNSVAFWPQNEVNLPASPDYNKNDESFERSAGIGNDKSDAQENDNIDKTEFSKDFKNVDLNSPKSLFVYLSNGLRQSQAPKGGPEIFEATSPAHGSRGGQWDGNLDDPKRANFRLNLINIDDNIMVPEISNSRPGETGTRGGLFSSIASEKSRRLDPQ